MIVRARVADVGGRMKDEAFQRAGSHRAAAEKIRVELNKQRRGTSGVGRRHAGAGIGAVRCVVRTADWRIEAGTIGYDVRFDATVIGWPPR